MEGRVPRARSLQFYEPGVADLRPPYQKCLPKNKAVAITELNTNPMSSGWREWERRRLRLQGRGRTVAARKKDPTKMKTNINPRFPTSSKSRTVFTAALTLSLFFTLKNARADETCSSPYLARIDGQEDFVYVWTLGVEGLGDGSDKLVTVDVRPGSPNYGKVLNSV